MTRQQYIISRTTNIIELSQKLGKISLACKNLGVSRQHYYDIKAALEEEGIEGLLEKTRTNPRTKNRVAPEIEQRLLAYSLEHPAHGQLRVFNELKKNGITLNPGGVRSIWLRHGLEVRKLRLNRLEKWSAKNNNILTESQVEALEKAKEEKQSHGEIKTHHPGFLLGQDTLYVGWIKCIGKIYQQTGIDTFSNVGFAKVYLEKAALNAADFLNDKVLPFFDSQSVRLLQTLTDRGTEYCGVRENYAYQLFLYLSDIEHTRTKAHHPQTNGSTERLNQTIKDEFYAVAFRRKVYKTLDEIQTDLDVFMEECNFERTNQGKHCVGRTPVDTFTDSMDLCEKYVIENKLEGNMEAA